MYMLIQVVLAAIAAMSLIGGAGALALTDSSATPINAVATPLPPEQAHVLASIVQVRSSQPVAPGADVQPQAQGLGIAVAGGILVSDRVVGDADQAEVITGNRQPESAQVVWRSPSRDLVLLRTDLALSPANLDAATRQAPDEPVAIMGYEPNDQGDLSATVVDGRLGAVQQDQEGITQVRIQARMDPGFVAGAIVNGRGDVIGGPSVGVDTATGSMVAVGAEEAQLLLSQPPTAATSSVSYQGDGHDLLPTSSDVGAGWQAAPLPPGELTASAGDAPVSERLVSGDPNSAEGPFADLRPVVLVAPDAEHARWAWERGLRHPPAGITRLPDPSATSNCHAYQKSNAGGTEDQVVVVACQEANVALGVSIAGTPDLATSDTAIRLVDLMARRVRSAAR